LAAIILYCMASSRLFMNLFDCLSDGWNELAIK
jgi:hypothetical protein